MSLQTLQCLLYAPQAWASAGCSKHHQQSACTNLQGVYEVWGEGSTWEQLQAAIESCPAALKAPWSSGKASWRIKVDGWGRVISLKEQVRLINRLAFLRFQVSTQACHLPGSWNLTLPEGSHLYKQPT